MTVCLNSVRMPKHGSGENADSGKFFPGSAIVPNRSISNLLFMFWYIRALFDGDTSLRFGIDAETVFEGKDMVYQNLIIRAAGVKN